MAKPSLALLIKWLIFLITVFASGSRPCQGEAREVPRVQTEGALTLSFVHMSDIMTEAEGVGGRLVGDEV